MDYTAISHGILTNILLYMKKQNKIILVTGAAGFIGSHLCDNLLKDDYTVVALDNFGDNYNPVFKQHNVSTLLLNKKRFILRKIDICSLPSLRRIFRTFQISAVVHLAALTGVRKSLLKPLAYERVNVGGTYNLLYLSKTYGAKQFIFASSSSVYGNSKTPFRESQPAMFPLSPYAASKRAAELACWVFSRSFGLEITILRLFSVYGPRGRPDMAPYLFTEAILSGKTISQYGDGQSARDWTYIDDVVAAFKKTLSYYSPFSIINIGSGQPITLKKLIACLENECKSTAKIKYLNIRAEETPKTYANIAKAKSELGWQPKIELREGLTQFVSWYKKNRLA